MAVSCWVTLPACGHSIPAPNHRATTRSWHLRDGGAGVVVLQDAHVVLQALWGRRPPVPLVAQHQDVGFYLPKASSLWIDVLMRSLCRDRQTQVVSVCRGGCRGGAWRSGRRIRACRLYLNEHLDATSQILSHHICIESLDLPLHKPLGVAICHQPGIWHLLLLWCL